MRRCLAVIGLLTFFYSSAIHATRVPIQLDVAFQSISTSSNAQISLTSEILKETYCDGPDPDLFTLKILLGVSFENVGTERIILQRGQKLTSVVRVSSSLEDALANRFETTINNSIITTSHGPSAMVKRPPLSSFAFLSPGENYNTITEVSIPVPRNKPLPPAINAGTHYLQVGVWTWNESRAEAKLRERLWKKEGLLWSESLFSKPMPITVRTQPIAEDCNCQTAKIGRLAAVEIANQRMRDLGRPLKLHKSTLVSQGCEWQVVFDPKDHNSLASVFIIDKVNGRVLAEFQ